VRLTSLDAYRGAVLLLLAFFDGPNHEWREPIAALHPDKPWLQAQLAQFEHVEWAGLALWDMIQPSFMFLVGTSLAFSCASRARRGQSFLRMLGHAVYRAAVLILLGVFLRSLYDHKITYWTFEDVVTQIGSGYVFLFLLWNRDWKVQLAAVAVILFAYWALFALWPLRENYDYAAANGQAIYQGFLAHWNKNANPAHYFDLWFLNLFPREKPFVGNGGGYDTLNFVPSLATMIMGLMAGELLRGSQTAGRKILLLLGAGVVCCALGAALHFGGMCPIVKRIWTPSFALFSGGLCLAVLALLYAVIDVAGLRLWAVPAIVVGQNSIAMYCMIHLIAWWILDSLRRHLPFLGFGEGGTGYQPMLENFATGLVLWLICYWMYRRKIFLRI
jgi:heparan-alpha-glucosaminide N-acetyltransferase